MQPTHSVTAASRSNAAQRTTPMCVVNQQQHVAAAAAPAQYDKQQAVPPVQYMHT